METLPISPAARAGTIAARSRGTDGVADELVFPAASVVLLTGIPGAGKSTLLRRLYATTGQASLPERVNDVRILDSVQVRDRWAPALRAVPYRYWRLFVHFAHYCRVIMAIARGDSVVVHDCGTRPWVRHLLGWAATRWGRQVHLLMLDVRAAEALHGQRRRGRAVGHGSFARHCRRWAALVAVAGTTPGHVVKGAASATILDRATADRLRGIRFR